MNRLSFRILWREARSGELRLLVLSLILAVAAVTAVGFLGDRVRQALEAEASQLLGADLVLAADHPIDEAAVAEADRRGLSQARTLSFPSMVMSTGGFRLSDVKAVSETYPLRGQLQLSSSPEGEGNEHRGAPERGKVWLEPRLGIELGLSVGDSLQLGSSTFRVGGFLMLEPDRGVNFIGLAPRLMMNLADVEQTGLLQFGARVTHRLLLAGERQSVRDFAEWVRPKLERGERLEEGSRQEVRSALDRARRFLGLASLLTVMLSAAAMAMAVRRYTQRHLDTSALLRCLGASRAQVLLIYLRQFLLMGLAATMVGIALGYLVHFALHEILAGLLRARLPAPSAVPVFQGLALGLVLLLGFALPPLLRLHKVPPLRVLRRDLGDLSATQGLAYLMGFGVLAGLIFWIAEDTRLGLYTLGAFTLALGIFLVLARAALWLMARGRHSLKGFAWRYALASLERQPWSSSFQVLALALGFMALLLLTVIRSELLAAWQHSVPADAPNRFIINIQQDQQVDLARRLEAEGWAVEMAPMVRGRLVSLAGRPVSSSDYPDDERARRLVEREFNLSWRAELPPGNRLEAGAWFSPESKGEASVESGLAKTLGIHLGDELVFNIAGQEIPVRVTSLRALNWDSMRINFFVLLPPGIIEGMPASYLANFYLPDGEGARLGKVVADYPSLTVIDIQALLLQLRGVISQVSLAVQLVFLFALVAGVLVLHGALVAALDERRASLAILRALGAARFQLQASLMAELGLIGALAGLLAALGAVAAGQVLAWRLFDLILPATWWLIPAAIPVGALVTMGVGRMSLRLILSRPPAAILRAAD